MFTDVIQQLGNWNSIDTSIVMIAAVAAMACALPGNFLVIRRQSMMGDALSHTTLPGVVIAFLLAHTLRDWGWLGDETYRNYSYAFLFVGAIIIGIVSSLLTEWVRRVGRVEASAALGVVYASMFALGLLLIRLYADNVHIDPDCVLYGSLETQPLDVLFIGNRMLPRAVVVNGTMLLVNGLLVLVFYKELKISAFDPGLANSLGINARWMHYGLISVTAGTLVMAFESVGSILVIAMLITPAATAHLLTDRMSRMLIYSLIIAAASAVVGHGLALVTPTLLRPLIGDTGNHSASTAGMMAVACGGMFVAAMLLGPRYGILSRLLHQLLFKIQVAREDVLGVLFRREERGEKCQLSTNEILQQTIDVGVWWTKLALWRLQRSGEISLTASVYELTDAGRVHAQDLVKSHRLWEAYMAEHFQLPADHLHPTAARVEHFIDSQLREQLSHELQSPEEDPHGRKIPNSKATPKPANEQSRNDTE